MDSGARPESFAGVEASGGQRDSAWGADELSLECLDSFDQCRREWVKLAEDSGNLFATWDWASIWWRHFGRNRPLQLIGARRSDGTLAAIVPLYEALSRPLRVARLVGHGPADQLGPVSHPRDHREVARALHRAPGAVPRGWDLLLAERLLGRDRWSKEIAQAVLIRREPSPLVRTDGMSWEEFLSSRSANFRQQVRRRERRLIREHGLRLRLSEDPDELERDLDLLLSLHAARWGRASGAFSPVRRAFHRQFAARALERGWLRLWIAEAGGDTVAAWYGFRFGGADWYYQAGRDPAWEQASVGFVLLTHTLRETFEAGMREYRLLLGGEAYKDRFATGDLGLETLVLAATPRGRRALGFGAFSTQISPTHAARLTGRLIDRGTRR